MDKVLQTNNVLEVRRVITSQPGSVVGKEQSVIKTVGCDKIVLKTSYTGAQGPQGDVAQVNNFQIEDLAARFRSKLV